MHRGDDATNEIVYSETIFRNSFTNSCIFLVEPSGRVPISSVPAISICLANLVYGATQMGLHNEGDVAQKNFHKTHTHFSVM